MKRLKPFDLTEEEITVVGVDELRDAYRELIAETRALRALIGNRTRAAVGALREQELKFNGNLPYGLEADDKTKKLRASRYEKRLITEIKKLHAMGLGLHAIARTLTERHFVNRDGNALDAKLVARLLDAAGVERKRRPTTTAE